MSSKREWSRTKQHRQKEDSQQIFHKKSVNRSRKGEKEENLFFLTLHGTVSPHQHSLTHTDKQLPTDVPRNAVLALVLGKSSIFTRSNALMSHQSPVKARREASSSQFLAQSRQRAAASCEN
jgi:hypothetical protein